MELFRSSEDQISAQSDVCAEPSTTAMDANQFTHAQQQMDEQGMSQMVRQQQMESEADQRQRQMSQYSQMSHLSQDQPRQMSQMDLHQQHQIKMEQQQQQQQFHGQPKRHTSVADQTGLAGAIGMGMQGMGMNVVNGQYGQQGYDYGQYGHPQQQGNYMQQQGQRSPYMQQTGASPPSSSSIAHSNSFAGSEMQNVAAGDQNNPDNQQNDAERDEDEDIDFMQGPQDAHAREARREKRRKRRKKELIRQICCLVSTAIFSTVFLVTATMTTIDVLKLGSSYVEYYVSFHNAEAYEVMWSRMIDRNTLSLDVESITSVYTKIHAIELLAAPNTLTGKILYGYDGKGVAYSINTTCSSLKVDNALDRFLGIPCQNTSGSVIGDSSSTSGYSRIWGGAFLAPGTYSTLRVHYCPIDSKSITALSTKTVKGSVGELIYSTSSSSNLKAPIPCTLDVSGFNLKVVDGERKRINLDTVMSKSVRKRTDMSVVPNGTLCNGNICGIPPTFTYYARNITRTSFMDLPVCLSCPVKKN